MIDTIVATATVISALGGGYALVWLTMHLLAEPGTEVKVIGVGSYTKRPKRPRAAHKTKAGRVETDAQVAILAAYAILDETSAGNERIFKMITDGTSLSKIDCDVALQELIAVGFLGRGSVGTGDGWHHHLTDAGKRWIQENQQTVDLLRK